MSSKKNAYFTENPHFFIIVFSEINVNGSVE